MAHVRSLSFGRGRGLRALCRQTIFDIHSEMKVHPGQDRVNLVKGLFPEILVLEHLFQEHKLHLQEKCAHWLEEYEW